jgi:orotidine-5'-phosphate decarboxylase
MTHNQREQRDRRRGDRWLGTRILDDAARTVENTPATPRCRSRAVLRRFPANETSARIPDMASFPERLHAAVRAKRTPALVGLDPRWRNLPDELQRAARDRPGDQWQQQAWAFEVFCRRVIDIVAPWVPAVKPQTACFELCGSSGGDALCRVMQHARQAGLLVIADGKRGDIGISAEAYAEGWLAGEDPLAAPWPADALTVNPYLGPDTLRPFVETAEARGAGVYVLVRTSNPESGAVQELVGEGRSVAQHVAAEVQRLSEATLSGGPYGCVGAVVGATYPEELSQLRTLMPASPLLIPGYGAQGGAGRDTAAAFDEHGLGALVNNSRGVIYACERPEYRDRFRPGDWEQAIEAAVQDFIADLATATPAGRLAAT